MDRKGEKRGKGRESNQKENGRKEELLTFHEEELIRMGMRMGIGMETGRRRG